MTNEAEIRECLQAVNDPEIGRSLVDLKMISKIEQTGDQTTVEIQLPTPAYPQPERITAACVEAIQQRWPELQSVDVKFTSKVEGKNAGGNVGLNIKNIIAVGSGKGGVGKSTVSTCLAYGLQSYGAKVGLMDADVYGPSIPHMVGASGQPDAKQIQNEQGETITRIEPMDANGLKVISMGFFVEPEKAVVWRGPMLHRAITQFLRETDWGELDYLIIDMPPGTGDVSLTLSQSVGLAGAVVVCTPQQVALLDAVKAIDMFKTVKIPVLGMVENMSGDIFGRGGTREKAEEMGVPFLGEIPIEAGIRIRGDEGEISKLFTDDNPSKEALLNVCQRTAIQIAKELLETPSMPTLEII